jgi:hypothetical protein
VANKIVIVRKVPFDIHNFNQALNLMSERSRSLACLEGYILMCL